MRPYENMSLELMDGEEWKPDIDFGDNYQISNMGRVKSIQRQSGHNYIVKEKILKQSFLLKKGYLTVAMANTNGKFKTYLVHRRVGFVFIPNPYNKKQINHKKGIKWDNRASELEWSTNSENHQHSYRILGRIANGTGLFGDKHHRSKKVKCDTLDIVFGSIGEAARELGLERGNISNVCLNKLNFTGGFSFRYI